MTLAENMHIITNNFTLITWKGLLQQYHTYLEIRIIFYYEMRDYVEISG